MFYRMNRLVEPGSPPNSLLAEFARTSRSNFCQTQPPDPTRHPQLIFMRILLPVLDR